MKDPEYLADARRLNIEVNSMSSGMLDGLSRNAMPRRRSAGEGRGRYRSLS